MYVPKDFGTYKNLSPLRGITVVPNKQYGEFFISVGRPPNSGDSKGKAPVQWKAKSIARGKHLTGQAELQALPGRTPPRREGAERGFFVKGDEETPQTA